ncbi:MAG: hypothetical protein QOG64_33 [Acidimicrobiaceae bacterium]|jgi:UPF0755 protein|nr:hypothetical protein [Acidimicrobiaceae bacterium]
MDAGTLVEEDDEPEYEDFPVRRRSRRRVFLVAGAVLVVLALLVGGLGYSYVNHQVHPSGGPGPQVQVTIPQGASTSTIAKILKRNGVIDSSTVFSWYVRFESDATFLAGDYTLRKHEPYREVVSTLSKAVAVAPDRITIPEGFTLAQIAARVGKLPGRSAQKFLDVAATGQIRSQFSPPGSNNLEGLLFPDTYFVTAKDDEAAILRRMVQAFDDQAAAAGLADASAKQGMTPYQVVIVASMVEREAKVDSDRGKIASVISNRLKRKMTLDIDATLIFAVGKVDKTSPSPFNTYKVAGLPPTPIASPGRPSLAAAAAPDDTPFLYYVIADQDGHHAFATTLAEHNRNVAAARKKGLL